MSLSINLSTHIICAQLMCDHTNISQLTKKALKTDDALLMKLLAHLARLDGEYKMLFLVLL